MTDSIHPALTQDQWKDILKKQSLADSLDYRDTIYVEYESSLHVGNAHGIAAACLYGQPFGFTQDEAELIRTISEEYPLLRPIADKIRALLPPYLPV